MAKGQTKPSQRPKATFALDKPVFLIGFMGAGKSTVARKIARMCGVSSIDMDTYVERKQGRKISEIFAEDGEEAFRTFETQALQDFIETDHPAIVSCGGGLPMKEQNRQIMSDAGLVVHLEVDAEEASNRISDKSSRPLFQDQAAANQMCFDRLPVYEQAADLTIHTIGKNPYQVARELCAVLKKRGILCEQ